MNLSHYTAADKPLLEMKDNFAYHPHKIEQREKRYFKPLGLWVSVDGEDDWPHWCTSEDFGTETLARRYKITLASNANVLHLSCEQHILAFVKEYHIIPYWCTIDSDLDWYGHFIDWNKLADERDGLIIAPYLHGLRFERGTDWMFSWDCASGCIWRSRAIASIEEDLTWTYCKE